MFCSNQKFNINGDGEEQLRKAVEFTMDFGGYWLPPGPKNHMNTPKPAAYTIDADDGVVFYWDDDLPGVTAIPKEMRNLDSICALIAGFLKSPEAQDKCRLLNHFGDGCTRNGWEIYIPDYHGWKNIYPNLGYVIFAVRPDVTFYSKKERREPVAEVEKILDTVASFRKAVTKVFDFSITESLNHEDSFRMLREHLVMFDTAIPQATEMAATAVAVDKWSKFKSVFVFSPDFMNALLNTEPLPIQIEVFKKLPQNRFFVYYPQVGSLGFFVNVEIETKKQAIINIYNLVECNVNTCQLRGISYGVPVIDGENMKDIFDRVIATGYSLSEKNPYELHLLISNTVFQVLLVLCYLASDNADIVPVKSKKKDRQKGRLGIRLNLNKWDVGYNIAEQLLMASEEEAERQLPQSWHPGAVQSKAPSARFEYRKAGFFRPTSTLKWVHPLLPEGESS